MAHAKMGMQLAHAGRKASTDYPWSGGKNIAAIENRGWQTIAPTALPYADGWQTPAPMQETELLRVKQAFQTAAERCIRIGFDVLELHMAHGYLLHQFLSPISNQRRDHYGGDLDNRMRYPLEIFDAVRAVWPESSPLGVRISATDWIEESSWNITEAAALAEALKKRGCDFIDVSSGGNSPAQRIDAGPGYQTGFAADIRRASGLNTIAVGQITSPQQAESILRSGQADMVALARGMLYNPHWAWHAAETLHAEAAFPPQYARSPPLPQWTANPGEPATGEKLIAIFPASEFFCCLDIAKTELRITRVQHQPTFPLLLIYRRQQTLPMNEIV